MVKMFCLYGEAILRGANCSRLRFVRMALLVIIGFVGEKYVVGAEITSRPNVLLIMTDDQGFGDLGVNGNKAIRTPILNKLARDGITLARFHVSPVCAPTRASLMTGRYNYRTRAIDTYIGRAMMDPEEVTLAEMLGPAGYATGIFGKWHLGDNYPLRACDQGFEESLVHRGGGLVQPAGVPGESYFDPELLHNGKAEKRLGYCTDIFADAASDFIRVQKDRPWFTYLAFNAPHDPLEVPEESLREYDNVTPMPYPETQMTKPAPVERVRRIYAMVTRVDTAIGRVLSTLEETGQAQNTIVIFLTDNGPTPGRFNAGMRGHKGTVYEGGIHVPCFIRWPARFPAGKVISDPAMHLDLTPTILASCNVPSPKEVIIDGVDLLPRLEGKIGELPTRTLFFQWHRGDEPKKFRAFAALRYPFKLVQAEGTQEKNAGDAAPQLFDLSKDPFETTDISQKNPSAARELRQSYERWFEDVSQTRGYDPPRIIIGSSHEDPVRLTRQDWRGPEAAWREDALGHWELAVESPGKYRVTSEFSFPLETQKCQADVNGKEFNLEVDPQNPKRAEGTLTLGSGPARLIVRTPRAGKNVGPHYVYLSRITASP